MNRILLGLFCLLLLFTKLNGQENCQLSLSGYITDEHDGSDLSYANLQLINSKGKLFGVSADNEGEYELGGLCPGEYQVIISHIGCQPDTQIITLTKSLNRNFQLEHHLEELQEVEVRESEVGEVLGNENQLSDESKQEDMGKSMAEMLKSLPGVNSFNTGANISKPMIGGFTSNRIQIVNSGVNHANQNWGDEHAPEIDPFAEIDYRVIKGAAAVKYGSGALGGYVLLEPKSLPSSAGINGKVQGVFASNNRLYGSSLMLEGKLSKLPELSWRAQISQRRGGTIRSPGYYQRNTGMSELNYSWHLGWMAENWKAELQYSLFNSEIGVFSGAHIGNLSDLRNAIQEGDPREVDQGSFSYSIDRPYQLIKHELLKADFSRYFENGKLRIQLSRQFNIREEFDKERPRNRELAALNIPEFSLSLESYQARVSHSFQWKEIKLEWGGGLALKDNQVNSFVDFIPDYQSTQADLFLLSNWEKGLWTFEAAFRTDYTHLMVDKLIMREFQSFEHQFQTFTTSLGASYELNEFNDLNFSLTYAERPPAINELYSEGLHHGTATLEFGNAELEKERSFAFRTTWNYTQGRFSFILEPYLQYIRDFIYLSPSGLDLTIRGAFPSFDWGATDAFLRGFDTQFKWQLLSYLELRHKSSWLWASNEGDGSSEFANQDYLVNMPANRLDHQIRFSSKSQNSALKNLELFLGQQYVFRQHRYDEEVEIAPPPAAYQLWYAGFNKPFDLTNKVKGQIGIKVNNLFDLAYRDYLNRFRFYADEMGRDVRFNLKLTF